VLSRPEQPEATIACEDIGVLIVDHPQVTYTHGVFTSLLDAGAAVVLCGGDHHPAGLLLPLDSHGLQAERHRAQIGTSEALRARLWQQLVGVKLGQQGAVLRALRGRDEGLSALARRVAPGDAANLEGEGARRYWPALLGTDFRRKRGGPTPNHLLNYGYTVLRAATARAVVAAGLIPTLGLFHHHRANAFCLADDLMEPFRPFVDLKVVELVAAGLGEGELDRERKATLISVLNETVTIGEVRTPVQLALHRAASSLRQVMEAGRGRLRLPSGLFVAPDGADGGAG
jgi:CRISPR-associated protein Cas1